MPRVHCKLCSPERAFNNRSKLVKHQYAEHPAMMRKETAQAVVEHKLATANQFQSRVAIEDLIAAVETEGDAFIAGLECGIGFATSRLRAHATVSEEVA